MTREEEVYYATLNTLGSDVEPPEIQALIDKEHAAAEPAFAAMMALRASLDQVKALRFVRTLNQGCGVFVSDSERDLYTMAVKTWNMLQDLAEAAEAVAR